MDNRPIGVFDSGVGGLTVVKELMRELPNENIIYFGDTARVPYGSKSIKTIERFSLEILNFLLKQNVKAVVIACNSASAAALKLLQDISPVPVYGVVDAGVYAALEVTRNNKIGIVGTKATIRTNAHRNLFMEHKTGLKLFTQACPLFVPLIEEGMLQSQITENVIQEYLKELKNEKIDTLFLGCTHYPLLKERIESFLGPTIKTIDPAIMLAKQIKENPLLNNAKNKTVSYKFFVSDVPEDFLSISARFLEMERINVEKIVLDEIQIEKVMETLVPVKTIQNAN